MLRDVVMAHLKECGYEVFHSRAYRPRDDNSVILNIVGRHMRRKQLGGTVSVSLYVNERSATITLIGHGTLELADPEAFTKLGQNLKSYFQCHPGYGKCERSKR